MTASAVAEIVAVSPVVIPATAIALMGAWLTMYALIWFYDYSLGTFLRVIAEGLRKAPLGIGGMLARQVLRLDNYVMQGLGAGLDRVELMMGRTWHAVADLATDLFGVIEELARNQYQFGDRVVKYEIPAQVGARTKPMRDAHDRLRKDVKRSDAALWKALGALSAQVAKQIAELLGKAQKGIDNIRSRDIPRMYDAIEAARARADYAAGRARLAPRVRPGEKVHVWTAAGITALAVAALTRRFPWYQCSNVRAFNRAVCRMPVGMLTALLTGALVFLSSRDACTLMGDIGRGMKRAVPAVTEVVSVVDAGLDCAGDEPPAALPIRTHTLPTPAAPLPL